jgi:broad specificity phosphatase PhoE
MEVYFIRHGQTNGNVARRHQHVDTPLNATGALQVKEAAVTVAKLNPTHIVTSTQLRAMESARIIATACGLTPHTHTAFAELHRPTWLVGHHYLSLTTLRYVYAWFFGGQLDSGETYENFLNRTTVAKAYLETFPPDARVVVVSHSVFTNVFLEHLCLSTKMSLWRACVSFVRIFRLRNAGIVHLRYSPGQALCNWSIIDR